MQTAKTLLIFGFVVMAGAIAYAMIAGDFWEEARTMVPLPWFHLTMIDLYVGFLLFAGWILHRERSVIARVVWLVALLTLGNLVACLYALMAVKQSRGDVRAFWSG